MNVHTRTYTQVYFVDGIIWSLKSIHALRNTLNIKWKFCFNNCITYHYMEAT